MGELSPYLQDGQHGAWRITGERGSVLLQNSQSAGDITYYFLNPKPGEEGQRDIRVKVQLLDTSEYSWAGLLYGYRDDPRQYYLFGLQANGAASLYLRGASGFTLLSSQTLTVNVEAENLLRLRERGDTIELWVNDRQIGAYGNDTIGRGAVGVAAGDIGAYRFSGFSVAATGARAAGSDAAGARPFAQPAAADHNAGTPQAANAIRYEEEYDPELKMVRMRMPIPADWERQPEGTTDADGEALLFKSADGVVVYENRIRQTYIPSGSPMLDNSMRQQGHEVEPYQPVEQLMRRVLVPAAQAEGARLLKAYKVPALLDFHRQEVVDDAWFRQHFDTWAADWEQKDGSRVLTMAVQISAEPTRRSLANGQGAALGMNLVVLRSLEAPAAVFERAKESYIASVANIELNAIWHERKRRQYEQQMLGIENEGRANLARALSAQRSRSSSAAQTKLSQTYSEISDITHSGYMTRSDINYAGHQSSVNGILERTTISGANGSAYSVPAGSNHYWVNQNTGRYIATDNPLFDPRVNTEIQGQWEPYQVRP